MTRLLPILSTTTAVLWALPAAAQITADDVWSNSQALYESFGATQSARLVSNGPVITVQNDTIEWVLPMGIGEISITQSDYTLTENADGTVTITYLMPYSAQIRGRIQGEGEGSIALGMGPDPVVTTASGSPGAITYITSIGPSTVTMSDLKVTGVPESELEFSFSTDSVETLTRVIEDDLTVMFSESTMGPSSSQMTLIEPGGFSTTSESRYGPTTSTLNMGLIPGGADILNLSTALRDGMYITASSSTTNSETITAASYYDGSTDQQTVTAGPGEASFSFDRDGIGLSGSGRDLLVEMEQSFLPYDIGFDIAGFEGSFQIPLLADTAPQDFSYVLDLEAVRLGPSIWNLFDENKQLDRSPADLGLNLSGSLINKVDWLDILSLEGLNFDDELPVDIMSLSISDLTLAGLGARLTGQGAFTFDAGDTVTYPGVPRPTGEAAIEASGVNGAIDALADIGLIPSDALFGFRMGLGMVTNPGDGPDTLTSRIEMTQDGKIIANGQQLR